MHPHRKEFLKLLTLGAAGATLPCAARLAARQAAAVPSKTDLFALKVLEDVGAAWRGGLTYIGDRLGIYKAMATAGPLTAAELARKTSLNARMLREWLNAMVAAGYVEYRPAGKQYFLPPEHAAVLADEESSPLFLGGWLELIVPMVGASNKVAAAFRTGKPITMDDFAPELFEGMERASAPEFKHKLVQSWIPAVRDVEAKLRRGGSAVDLGCGSGLASIVLARAFPTSRFFGYDPHNGSIARARANAKSAGVAARVEFVAGDASRLPAGRFDLLTIFNSVHHFSDPVGVLTASRKSLAPGGVCLIYDMDLSPDVEKNMTPVGRMAYAATTLWCLHDSMANNGAGIGSDMNEDLMRKLARDSGFTRSRRLPFPGALDALYELRA